MEMDINNLPDELTVRTFLMVDQFGWITMHTDEMDNYIVLSEMDVTFKLKPREDVVNESIARLRAIIKETRAKAETECKQIEEKIQSLLALPSS